MLVRIYKIFTQGKLFAMVLVNGMQKTLQKVDKRWILVYSGQTEEKGPHLPTFEFECTHNIFQKHFVFPFVGLEQIFIIVRLSISQIAIKYGETKVDLKVGAWGAHGLPI